MDGKTTVRLQVDDELNGAIEKQAAAEDRTKANMIRVLVKRGLAATKGPAWEAQDDKA